MKKNILIFDPNASDSSAGAPMRVHKLALLLSQEGYNVTLFRSHFSHMRLSNYNGNNDKVDNFKIISSPSISKQGVFFRLVNLFLFQTFFILFLLYARIRLKRFDAIINATNLPVFFFSNFISKLIFKCKLIVDIRDLFPLSLFENFRTFQKPLIKTLTLLVTKINFYNVDCMVSTICGADAYYKGLNVDIYKSYAYINNFYHNSTYQTLTVHENQPEIGDVFSRYRFLVGYAGSMRASNGVEVFIEAAKLLADYDIGFVFIGAGRKVELLSNLEHKNIHYLGHLPYFQARSLIRKFDLGLVGGRFRESHYYGISQNKLFEYIGNDVDVLVNVRTDYEIYIDRPRIYYVKEFDPNVIAKRILDIAVRSSTPASFSTNSVLLDRSQITEQHFIKSYIRVIDA